ncbi:PorT family protein [Hymenobacter sp. 15J16-1T3B]|uniref:porin family protein n=1 Tax=Hymenobacter sp. 15J16-1T3B TaxID=2886941 RepID=UPI001D124E7A|nr:porin family protein [Hymenobacter sp. 15J16-1T3B]MCC3159736.1 PorT family protein [Hymenobacter sp. 15J16-1T3B]
MHYAYTSHFCAPEAGPAAWPASRVCFSGGWLAAPSTGRRQPRPVLGAAGLVALLWLAAAGAHAQPARGLCLGPKTGFSLAGLAGDVTWLHGPNYRTRQRVCPGFSEGVALQIPLAARNETSLQPELLVTRTGYRQRVTQTAGLPDGTAAYSYRQNRMLTYLSLPVLAQMNTARVFMELGPQLDYLVQASTDERRTTEFTNQSSVQQEHRAYSGRQQMTPLCLSGVAGLGYRAPKGWTLNARYYRSFTKMFDAPAAEGASRVYATGVLLQAGYLFRLSRPPRQGMAGL